MQFIYFILFYFCIFNVEIIKHFTNWANQIHEWLELNFSFLYMYTWLNAHAYAYSPEKLDSVNKPETVIFRSHKWTTTRASHLALLITSKCASNFSSIYLLYIFYSKQKIKKIKKTSFSLKIQMNLYVQNPCIS